MVPELTPQLIKHFNKKVLHGLTLDSEIHPGEVRTYSVGVADYRTRTAEDCDELLDRLCTWLREPWVTTLENYTDADRRRLDAVLKAVVVHIYLAWIHPFGDGNGRTARLVEFYILATGGVPFPAAHLLSNHYNETPRSITANSARRVNPAGRSPHFSSTHSADSSISFANKSA